MSEQAAGFPSKPVGLQLTKGDTADGCYHLITTDLLTGKRADVATINPDNVPDCSQAIAFARPSAWAKRHTFKPIANGRERKAQQVRSSGYPDRIKPLFSG